MGTRLLSASFKSVKPRNNVNLNVKPDPLKSSPSQLPIRNKASAPSPSEPTSSTSKKIPSSSWSVYLILSTNPPIKTYVGVTNNFNRRLKQHNGELQSGAKASRAGRPWICACLIGGFLDKSQAWVFESKWKSLSSKLTRRSRSRGGKDADDVSLPLLQHRQAALDRVKESIDCSHLKIDWHLTPY